MATVPTRKPVLQQGTRPAVVQPSPPAPDVPDFDIPTEDEEEGEDGTIREEDLYQVFHTETVTPPPVKRLGRGDGQGLKLPFEKLHAVNQWFLLPPFPVDREARKKHKERVSSYVYKKRKDGTKFKLIELDERFATEIQRPELKGRLGVWRVA